MIGLLRLERLPMNKHGGCTTQEVFEGYVRSNTNVADSRQSHIGLVIR